MLRPFALFALIASVGLAAWGAEALERPVAPARAEATLLPWEAGPLAGADTLRYSVKAGTPLIVALPGVYAGQEANYRLLEAPALSWLVDRSFLWRTTEQERGVLPILIERLPSRDTLVLLVELQP